MAKLQRHRKDWCWSWNSSTLATSCEELTHWKRPWCCEGLGAAGEGDDRGWDGWIASATWWAWVWVNSRSWWWIGRPGVLLFMGSQRVRHNWATELNRDSKKISCCQDCEEGREKGIGRIPEDFYSSKNALYDIIMVDFIIHLSKPIECTTPRVNPSVKFELWVIMM